MLEAEGGGNVIEISHAAHIDPGLRYGDDNVGMSETQIVDEDDALIGVRNELVHEVASGEAEMRSTLRQSLHDLGSGEIGHADGGKIGDAAAIIARSARLDEGESRAREKALRVLLQPPFGRYGDDESFAHLSPRSVASRSIHTANPTAGMGFALPSRVSNPS